MVAAWVRAQESAASTSSTVSSVTVEGTSCLSSMRPRTASTVGTMSVVNLDMAHVDAVSRDLKEDGLLKPENVGPSQNASLLGP